MKKRIEQYFSLIVPIAILSLFVGCAKSKGYSEEQFRTSYRATDFTLGNAQSGIRQDARASVRRQTIYVLATSNVPPEIPDLVVQGLEKIIRETGRSIQVVKEESGAAQGYRPSDWYQDEALLDKEYRHGRQANAGAIIDLLRSHDTTKDHFVVFLADADLTSGDENNNFVYGLSSYPYIVVSARRFLDWKEVRRGGYPGEIFDQAVSLMAAHEFGHYLDLAQRNFNCWGNTGTLLENHCKGESGDCLMQQVNVNAEGCHTAEEEAELIFTRERWLCPDCAAEIYYRKQALVALGFAW
jgi:hypothetical protein